MKHVLHQLTLCLFSSALLGACAFSGNSTAGNQKEVTDRQKLQSTYSAVTGTYTGTLTTASAVQNIEMNLFTLDVKDGVNSDGSDKFRVVLKSAYKKISPVGAGYTYLVRFIPETSELILTNEDPKIGIDDIHTINAKVTGQRITGEAKSPTGIVGVIDLALSSRNAQKPGDNEKDDLNRRLRDQYNKVTGYYEGTVLPPENEQAPFNTSLKIYIVESIVNGETVPQLVGLYKLKNDPSGDLNLGLTISYRADLNPQRMTLSGKGAGTYSVYLDGFIENGDLHMSMTNFKGSVGEVVYKKVKSL